MSKFAWQQMKLIERVRWLRYLDVFRGEELIDQWPTFQPGISLV